MHPPFEITVNWNTAPQIIADSCSDVKSVKMAEKWLRNHRKQGERIVLKRLVIQREQTKSFKNWWSIKRKWEARNIHRKWEVSARESLCWSALGVAQGETSADLWWFSYHSCTGVALTTSKVLVTCVTTYRTDLRDNTCGLRNNQCTVATGYMHPRGVYSRFQVTGMIKGIFQVWNFHFQVFGGIKIWKVFIWVAWFK